MARRKIDPVAQARVKAEIEAHRLAREERALRRRGIISQVRHVLDECAPELSHVYSDERLFMLLDAEGVSIGVDELLALAIRAATN